MMHWKKLGQIFNPLDHDLGGNCEYFAQSPQTLVLKDRVRVYFSTRESQEHGMFVSKIRYVDFKKDFSSIIEVANHDVLPLGELGTFDEHGIFPINPLRVGDKIYAYTCGWSRRESVPVETSTGLVQSNDDGKTFSRIGLGPVFSASPAEPVLVGDSFVQAYNGSYHMFYIFGQRWKESTLTEPPARVYKIAQAWSDDGITWERNDGKAIIADVLNEDECQALPTVLKISERYHMYFCFREATDFRKNPSRGYRLGYAYSDDLKDWTRADELAGIAKSKSGWDNEMMCYPHIFEVDGEAYLLYNGNEFGRFGFGLAKLNMN